MRNDRGQFVKGHTETEEETAVRLQSIRDAWKQRDAYTNGLAGTKFHNSWRAIRFTLKGKRAGCSDDWKQFKNFCRDMHPSYIEGYILARRDRSKPFNRENCYWVHRSVHRCTSKLIKLAYQGEELSLKEWALKLDISLSGLQQRYHLGKGYTTEEILFGKRKEKRKWNAENEIRVRASKLISTYRVKDFKRGHSTDIDKPWFIENILLKPCTYCGSHDRIGADRIDNSKGHIKENIIPCCHSCNTIRGDRFTVDEMMSIGEALKKIYRKRDEANRSS